MPQIKVRLGKRSYPVVVGSNISGRMPTYLKRYTGRGRVFVIYDAQVYALYGRRINRLLGQVSKVSDFAVPAGERSKSNAQLSRIYDFLLSERISRTDTIAACGGGVVSDLAGFAAATTQRGVKWITIPTTLIGMVDAAVGGKTAINHPFGKNQIGAFWQPSLVWCDLHFLMTLPERQLINGLAEILKYAGLTGGTLVDRLKNYLGAADLYNMKKLMPMVSQCVRYKAQMVSRDETDAGQRMFLNLGHTFGHALEAGAGYGRLLHGEALILGLKASICLSAQTQPATAKHLSAYMTLIDAFVPLVRRCKIDLSKALNAMLLDKKRRGAQPKFILLKKPGSPYIACDVTVAKARKALIQALSD